MGLVLTVKHMDVVWIGDIKVSLERYSHSQWRMNIEAPKDVPVDRDEIRAAKTSPPKRKRLVEVKK